MEIPFTPQFFKKLEIYQQIKTFSKTTEGKRRWNNVKELLLWTVNNHQHLNSDLKRDKVKEILNNAGLNSELIDKDIGNLIFYGYAKPEIFSITNEKKEVSRLYTCSNIIAKRNGKDLFELWELNENNKAKNIVKDYRITIESFKFTDFGLKTAEVLWEIQNKKINLYVMSSFLIWSSVFMGFILLFDQFLYKIFNTSVNGWILFILSISDKILNFIKAIFTN